MLRTGRILPKPGVVVMTTLILLCLSASEGFAAESGGPGLALLPSFELGTRGRAGARIHLAQAPVDNANSGEASLHFDIRDYRVEGNTLLSGSDIARLTARHRGRRKDFGDVQRALEDLQNLYQRRGYAGVLVTLPEQELDRGTVVFRVIEPRIGRVLVEGSEYFGADSARRSVPALKPGGTPNTREVAASVRVANENPAKQTAVLLRPGERDGEVDAVIRVADVPPLRYSVSLDNTGNSETGTYRAGFAFQHANLFDRDHVLTVQYVTSPKNINDVEVYGLGYRIPLYAWGDSIDLIAGYSTVDSGTVQELFDVSGQGAVYAFRYNHNLARIGDLEHRLVFGADYRAYQNLVTPVGGNFNFVPDITVRPLSMTYSGVLKQERQEISYYLSHARNLQGGNDGRDADFKNSRLNARGAYRIWRLGGAYSRGLGGDWQFRVKADAQYSEDALISAEQFGLGGSESIRGFNERYTSNDRGYRSSWEIYTPDLGSVIDGDEARLRFLAFYDSGQLKRNKRQPGELARVSLDSAGLGVRFSYRNKLTIKADFAQVLHDGTQSGTPVGRRYGNRWHFVLSYVF